MHDALLVSVALVIALIGIALAWKMPGECVCQHCSYHRNKRLEAAGRKRTQAETQHEVQHKGFGFHDDWADTMDCRAKDCRRNSGDRRIGP